MDMKEAEAMTEASGLTSDHGGKEQTSSPRSSSGTKRAAFGPQLNSPSSDSAARWADQLRELTMKAPLRAWIARRR
ncbi:hypothetical protein D6B98_18515 [Bradyrhizobium sp. LVM 105]|nr:hypothetical protein D6B98_18515 [Bradyrhizobium sp. LVM 105]